jgi:4-hydroxybenzoate polyprenyltransferase
VLRLLRLPNVFTAFANVVAGVVLARDGAFEPRDLLLVLASGAFYTAGMAFNDVFDREVDARERPTRPIPSGAVSVGAAAGLGAGLMAAGVVLAALHGPRALAVAAALVAAILLYDGGLKNTWAGPGAMGLCRLLNVSLGLAAAPPASAWLWVAPAAAGLYTAVLTSLARDEVFGRRDGRARGFVIAMAVLVGAVGALLFGGPPVTLAFLLVLVVAGARLFLPLWRDASGPLIGRAIGGGILLMPALDAVLVAGFGHPAAAVVVLALTVPALILRPWFYLT